MTVRGHKLMEEPEEDENEDSEETGPLTKSELKKFRHLVRDLDHYLFAIILIRKAVIGFAIMVAALYGGRDLISRIWKALFP